MTARKRLAWPVLAATILILLPIPPAYARMNQFEKDMLAIERARKVQEQGTFEEDRDEEAVEAAKKKRDLERARQRRKEAARRRSHGFPTGDEDLDDELSEEGPDID